MLSRIGFVSNSLATLLKGVAAACLGLMLAQPVAAQTAQQVQMFSNLSSDQQESILQSLGRGTSAVSSSGGSSAQQEAASKGTATSAGVAELTEEQRRMVLLQSRATPALQPGDTILLSVAIKEFEGDSAAAPAKTTDAADDESDKAVFKSTPDAAQTKRTITRSAVLTQSLTQLRERILRNNPYQLDTRGVLNLPGVNPIPVGGLSVDEAMERLNADPLLLEFNIGVTLLPVVNPGSESLKPYGYDLFANPASTFAPATDIPVPVQYVVGPGDTINVQLIGNNNNVYSLLVGRDGQVNFPTLGPIAVAGMSFERVRETLEQRVAQQMIGTQASITLGALRSIQVFVLGDVQKPGSYTVSSLSTMTNALLSSGGVKTIGSLRKVQLKRGGNVVSTLDLYDLLLKGDARADARLLAGDVIFVPPAGNMAGVTGQIKRPAMYELNGATTVAQLLELAGGLAADADGQLATLERIDEQRRRITLDVDISTGEGRAMRLRDGDVLNIPQVRPTMERSVLLDGYVYRPGSYQYREGMRLTDLLSSADELKPNADMRYVLIRRESQTDKGISVFSADLSAALAGNQDSNIALQARDRVYVFDLESGRDRVIQPLLRELRAQSTREAPTQSVRIAGSSNVEGEFPLESGMRISDLIRAGGGLDESAYEQKAELTRYDTTNGETRQIQMVQVDLTRVRAGDAEADLVLRPFDYLLVKKTPLWGDDEYVELSGEVRFPGRYPIQRGETLRSVLERAGGLTELAFPFGAAFTRVELRERERQQINELADRMQMDLVQVSLQTSQSATGSAAEALAVGQSLLNGLKSTQPVGRLVIDVEAVRKAQSGALNDILLKNGDRLVVPRIKQEVTVLGEVQSTTSHLHDPALSMKDYIELSGGVTRQADKKHIYVVRANGSVETLGNAWFGGAPDIKVGDTIVVPLNAYQIRPLTLWTSVTQIIYQMAIAAAAVNSF